MATNFTKITKLVDDTTKRSVQYLQITPSLDNSNKRYRCMWCTLDVETKPIGCPIDSVSMITDEKNSLREFSNRFITYGIFCSFNCAKSFAQERSHDSKFRHSIRLLQLMYSNINGGKFDATIVPAPNMCFLQAYGGEMTEAQYRNSFDRLQYVDKGVLNMMPVTRLFEETEHAD